MHTMATNNPAIPLFPTCKLTLSETENPYLVIEELFDFARLPELRQMLWDSFKANVTGSFPRKLHSHERMDIVSLYEYMEKLLEATHIINEHQKKRHAHTETSTDGNEEPVFYPYLPEHINTECIKTLCSGDGTVSAINLISVVQTIVGYTNAEKIFLVNMDTDENGTAHINLLVILPDRSPYGFVAIQQFIEARCAAWGSVLAWCGKWHEVESALAAGHIFYSAVCRPERLLYSSEELELPDLSAIDMAGIKEKARPVFDGLYNIATSFLDGARYYITTNQYPTAAFMLHQAMEHGLRALLFSLTAKYKYGHNLTTLIKLCSYCAPEIRNYFPQNTAEEMQLFELLKGAYVHPRYQSSYRISEEKLSVLMERVDRLHTELPGWFDASGLGLSEPGF